MIFFSHLICKRTGLSLSRHQSRAFCEDALHVSLRVYNKPNLHSQHTPKRTKFRKSLPRLEKSVRSFALPRVEGIRRRTRRAWEERKTEDKKPVTLHECTDMVDSRHKSRVQPGDETVEIRPQWPQILYTIPRFRTRRFHFWDPFCRKNQVKLTFRVPENQRVPYSPSLWSTCCAGPVKDVSLEFVMPCGVRVTDRGLAQRNYRNH